MVTHRDHHIHLFVLEFFDMFGPMAGNIHPGLRPVYFTLAIHSPKTVNARPPRLLTRMFIIA